MSRELQPLGIETFDGFEREIQHECGVYGIYAPGEPVALHTYIGLLDLQHRGQSGAGMAVVVPDGTTERLHIIRGEGLVPDALEEAAPGRAGQSLIDMVTGSPLAIGHTRYSTSGGPEGSQPRFGNLTMLAVAQNGHVEDIADIAAKFGIYSEAVSDSDQLTKIIDKQSAEHDSLDVALDEVLPHLEGSYSLTLTDGKRLIGVRDPWGIHPLVLGKLPDDKGYVLASETVALDGSNAEFVRDIEPGEIVTIDDDGAHSRQINRQEQPKHCMFENIYTARVDSVVDGSPVYLARKFMGRSLAEKYRPDADIVVGVPNSGLAAAAGYAEESGIRLVEGIFKDQYLGRSFIQAGQQRATTLSRKLRPNKLELQGQRLVLIDDSLIKGNTMANLIKILKEVGGASEVHVLSTAPRYKNACYMGMATGKLSELIARNYTDAEICEKIGADSIGFNEPEDIERAVNEAREAVGGLARPLGSFCTACATGEYPLKGRTFDRLNGVLSNRVVELGMPTLALSRA